MGKPQLLPATKAVLPGESHTVGRTSLLCFLQLEGFEEIHSLRDHTGQIGMAEFPPEGGWGIGLRQEERSSVSGGLQEGPRGRGNRDVDEAMPGLLIRGNPEGEGVRPSLFLMLHFVPLMGGFLKLFLRMVLRGITDVSNPCYYKKETKI